jgi:hypothetical protein
MDNLQKKIETGAAKGVNDSCTLLESDIKGSYLSGQSLNVVTNNLRSGITAHPATVGEIAEGAVSSTATSPEGFDYGAYHEYNDFVRNYSRYSSATGSHRAFMKPSFVKNSDKMQDIVKDRVKKEI